MTITSIRQTSRGRLTIALDSGEELRSTLGVVTELRLFTGLVLDEAAAEELRLASGRALARERALELVSQRQMSRRELETKLCQKGVDPETASYCGAWLLDRGLLDEAAYAAAVVRHYAAKGYGAGRVRSELGRRGVDRALWDEAVEQMPAADEKLHKFIAARLKDPNDREQLRKIGAALFRRGYSWEEIRTALRRYSDEIIEED